MITASLGKGPRGREAARAEAAKNDSPRIPEVTTAGATAPNCRNDLREGTLMLHCESLPMISPPQPEIEK
jgi:hypothetical protein